jgi:chemotaxis protein methyltransferase CheR
MISDTLSDSEFAVVQELMRRHSGQLLEPHRRRLCVLKLQQLAQAVDLGSTSELVCRLQSDADLQSQVVESLLNGETSFFRDPKAFGALQHHAIPALLAANPGTTSLKIWCAGCGSGQEPYSVAMLLSDMPAVQRLNVQILATDYSVRSLDKARAGRYSQLEVNRGLPSTMLIRHFEQAVREWTVRPALRARVHFDRIDVSSDELPVGTWDLILLRNVLIYFSLEQKQQILQRVVTRLAPHGLIMMGGSESTIGINDELIPAGFGHGFFRKRGPQ